MKLLYVNADDFGLHEDINRAIAEGVKNKCIQGVSVSANGMAADWLLLRELKCEGAAIGSHLTWVDEAWLTGGGGYSRAAMVMKLVGNQSGFVGKLRDEARAQIELMLKNGVQPDHLDSHQHIHVLPCLWSITLELAREYSIPRIRIPCASSFAGIRKTPGGILLQLLSRFRFRKKPTARLCAGIAHSGHNTMDTVVKELKASKTQAIELVVHPAFATDSLRRRYEHWNFDWEAERAMLMNDSFSRHMEACGFEMDKGKNGKRSVLG